MKKVFYVSYGGGHANISRFIYKELEKDPQVEQEVLSLTVADKIFDRSAVPYRHLTDYLDLAFSPEDKKEILRLGKELAESAHNPNSDVPYEQTVAYMGCGMWDLVKRFGEDEARRMFSEKERKSFYPIEVMKNILSYVQPDVLVITCEVRMEGAAAFAANEMGIPTVIVTDFPVFEKLNSPATYCVMNEFSKNHAVNNLGIPEDSIVITGQPVFEDDLRVTDKEIEMAKNAINFIKGDKIILFIAYSDQPETPEIINLFDKMSCNHKEWNLVIKLHPNNSVGYQSPNNRISIIRDMNIVPLLHLCDVAITYASTAGIEAALLEKPLICVRDRNLAFDFTTLCISEDIEELSALESSISDCLDDNSKVIKRLREKRIGFENKEHALENVVRTIRGKCK